MSLVAQHNYAHHIFVCNAGAIMCSITRFGVYIVSKLKQVRVVIV